MSVSKSILALLKFLVMLVVQPFAEILECKLAIQRLIHHLMVKFFRFIEYKYRKITLEARLTQVKSYSEWDSITKEIDSLCPSTRKWKSMQDTKYQSQPFSLKKMLGIRQRQYYDGAQVGAKTRLLRQLRATNDVKSMQYVLRQDLQKGIYGTASPELFKACRNGTRIDLEMYHNEMIQTVRHLYYYKGSQITDSEKVKFFQEVRQSYGQTALVLSGGANFATFHNGMVKALHECDLMPKVICGTSAGSLFAAGYCTLKRYEFGVAYDYDIACDTKQLIWKVQSYLEILQNFFNGKEILSVDQLKLWTTSVMRDMTFKDIYEKNGWILNITVSDCKLQKLRLCNYLTTPDVLVWSACVASCSIPELFTTQELYVKNKDGSIDKFNWQDVDNDLGLKYVDGSLSCDLPIKEISQLFNVTTYIVSQVNPHVINFCWDLSYQANSSIFQDMYMTGKRLVHNHIIHWFQQLDALGLLTRDTRIIRKMIHQTLQGHVVIVPTCTPLEFFTIFQNPTRERFHYCLQHTYLKMLDKIAHVRAHFGIEREVDRYLQRLLKQQRAAGDDIGAHGKTVCLENQKNQQIHKNGLLEEIESGHNKMVIGAATATDAAQFKFESEEVLRGIQEQTTEEQRKDDLLIEEKNSQVQEGKRRIESDFQLILNQLKSQRIAKPLKLNDQLQIICPHEPLRRYSQAVQLRIQQKKEEAAKQQTFEVDSECEDSIVDEDGTSPSPTKSQLDHEQRINDEFREEKMDPQRFWMVKYNAKVFRGGPPSESSIESNDTIHSNKFDDVNEVEHNVVQNIGGPHFESNRSSSLLKNIIASNLNNSYNMGEYPQNDQSLVEDPMIVTSQLACKRMSSNIRGLVNDDSFECSGSKISIQKDEEFYLRELDDKFEEINKNAPKLNTKNDKMTFKSPRPLGGDQRIEVEILDKEDSYLE